MTESRVLSFLSLVLGFTAFLFVSQQVKWLSFLRFTENNDLFYLAFALLGILSIGATFYFSQKLSWGALLEKILVIFLPTEIFIIFGLTQSKNFHYVFFMLIGGYVLLAGSLAIARYILRHRHTHIPPTEEEKGRHWFAHQGSWILLSVLALTVSFFSSSLTRLTEFAAVDEPLWTEGRITKYWHNIEDRDWKGTRISDKPGITVALSAGPGLWFVTPKEYRAVRHEGEVYNAKRDIQNFYLAFRLPFLIVITLLLPLFYFLLERLLGKRIALVSYALIALSPALIGISKIINPDSLLWLLAPLSLLAYLVYRKRRLYRYLVLAGVLMGLALLTKYVANIVFIFMLGVIFLDWAIDTTLQKENLVFYIKRSFAELGILTFTALSVFYALFPAVWVKPDKLITSTLYSQAFEKVAPLFLGLLVFIFIDIRWNKARTLSWMMALLVKARRFIGLGIISVFLLSASVVLVNVFLGMAWYDFVELLAAPKTISGKSGALGIFLTNFYPLLFGVTPVVVLGLITGSVLSLKKSALDTLPGRTTLFLIIFIILYFIGGAANGVAMITRYQVMLFPFAGVLAGIGLVALYEFLEKRSFFPQSLRPWRSGALFVVLLGASLPSVLFTPFPLSYASSLLPEAYYIDIKDMGPGSYEAAQWLNAKPNATNLLIWTDKDGVCKFFVGRCKRGFGRESLHPKEPFDYIVVSSGRESRTTKMIVPRTVADPSVARYDQYYARTDSAYEIDINGRPGHYVKVFTFEP
ncbi:MAG: glycosyltransferase family 39 protein [Candidatus Moraniibacteriota bacterium]